jgi:sister-chromatid-cohesion protein PDS5
MRCQGGVIDNDGEAITRRLNAVIQRLAGEKLGFCFILTAVTLPHPIATFSDPQKVAEDLHAFANLNEKRLYKLWTTCLDAQTDMRSLVKSTVHDIHFDAVHSYH